MLIAKTMNGTKEVEKEALLSTEYDEEQQKILDLHYVRVRAAECIDCAQKMVSEKKFEEALVKIEDILKEVKEKEGLYEDKLTNIL